MENRYPHESVTQFVEEVFCRLGARRQDAGRAAEVIVTADLFDIFTHGVERVPDYYEAVRHGRIHPAAQPEILRETPVSALVDGHEGIGHALAVWCMELAIRKAKESGVGIVSLRNSNHYGFAGYYPLMAIREHLIGFSVTNTEGIMVGTNSRQALLGTNPIAFGMYAEPYVFLLDMATTVIPAGKVSLYSRDGRDLERGWAVGADGRVCTDAPTVRACINSKKTGGILPLGGEGETFGGHKGYGLGLMVEILSGILAGGDTSNLIRRLDPWVDRNSEFFVAMDYGMFGEPAQMEAHLSDYLHTLRTAERADPAVPIYTHGEKEQRAAEYNRAHGVLIHEKTAQKLLHVAQELGIDFDACRKKIQP
ncbi:Ldh family oxidoreductase [Feifania hominis]|uniref:Ldh family oxidoreductase n=1 Tax=Feifania hominis TaxID=2763660 RepID=A0A926DDF9_9FIRM|nr:Ldh family oxidoreductase [Feifania hominis]MBC8535812.1 Ldh family oxidoreductase [Feifania hominis]